MRAMSLPHELAARPSGTPSIVAGILDGARGEARFFAAVAVALVLGRGITFALAETLSFDSEQAVIGLMAQHLSQFRTFPLFTYGQNYQLGVEAWLMAPFFWIFRPSVAVMRIPLVILNAVVAVMLVRLASSALRLRPAIAFLAALPFIMPTPIVGITLLENTGGAVEPLLYVLLLWMLRRWHLAFGALLGFGFLHREFTIYAVPAVALAEMADGPIWTAGRARQVVLAVIGFALVWLIVDDLRMHSNGTSLLLQAKQLGNNACLQTINVAARIRYVAVSVLPILIGGTTMTLHDMGKRSPAVVGSAVIGWAVGGAMLLMLVRVAWLWKSRRDRPDVGFGIYLTAVGCCALAAYPLACNAMANVVPFFRYLTLAMVLPVGCFATFMTLERSKYMKAAVVSVFVLWGAANFVDNVRVLQPAYSHPEPDPRRQLTDFLLSQGIRYARASFWDAYAIDFLSHERVTVGSSTIVRIPEYERRVDEHRDAAVEIVRMPCEGPVKVVAWCIQLPPR